jgi:hypothetical protein
MKLATATLNVWIEDVDKTKIWKYRYPVLNGECAAQLAIGDSIKPGKYAINFVLQPGLFKVIGHLRDDLYPDLNYLMLTKDRKSYFENVQIMKNGYFVLKNILFEDQAQFIFSPPKKVKRNNLYIDVTAPLDSAFEPLAAFSSIVDVKPELQTTAQRADSTPYYHFNFGEASKNTTLPDVVVSAKQKKQVEEYEKEYVRGLFDDPNAKTFDGFSSEEIANAPDIATFLVAHVPSISKYTDETGIERLTWRRSSLTIYIDEFKLDADDQITINPADVALIKVYAPPASMLNSGDAAAIAIYTKRGNFISNSKRKYTFTFKGYTRWNGVWK